jgi:serine/threonine-protein kinase
MMKLSSSQCHPETLERFLSGDLSRDELTALETHLSDCSNCEATLVAATAPAQMWHDTRTFLRDADDRNDGVIGSGTGGLDGLVRAILGPTDDPSMMGRLAGYEVSGVIGRGGMAIVLKARDVSLGRFVAIKVLDPGIAHSSAARRRFVREAQAAAAVIHDNVIAIFGVDHSGEHPFLVMPYIKGESLQQRIDCGGPLGDEDILNIALQIARGLSAAHDQGLVHRDIKPANILMPAGVSRVILTDFGLARAADDASLTRSGVIAGTPQYMSPEQITGQPVDGRADLFSLGSVMYAMACGHPPFRADTPYAVLKRIVDEPHRSISHIRPDTPCYLVEILDRLLDKDPRRRFQSAAALADHLEDCLAHIRQPTLTGMPKLAPRASRWPAKAILAAAILPAVAGALVIGMAIELVWWASPSSTDPASAPSVTIEAVELPDDRWLEEPELSSLEAELDVILKSFDQTLEPEK